MRRIMFEAMNASRLKLSRLREGQVGFSQLKTRGSVELLKGNSIYKLERNNVILDETGVMAEVAPVVGKPGWFQLTGNDIDMLLCYDEDVEQEREFGYTVVEDAKIRGWHNNELVHFDDRLNGRRPESLVVFELPTGKFRLMLNLSTPEANLFTLLITKTYPGNAGVPDSIYPNDGEDEPPLD